MSTQSQCRDVELHTNAALNAATWTGAVQQLVYAILAACPREPKDKIIEAMEQGFAGLRPEQMRWDKAEQSIRLIMEFCEKEHETHFDSGGYLPCTCLECETKRRVLELLKS